MWFDLIVNGELSRVYDSHIHPGSNGVIQKYGMHGFAYGFVSAEGEGEITDPTADVGEGHAFFDGARSFDEIDAVIIMLFESGGYGKNIRIEDDVLRCVMQFLGEEIVGALADLDFSFLAVGLTFFIEGHDDHGGAEALTDAGLFQKFFFAFFEGDGVHDAFPLYALESGFNDLEFGAVDHDRDAGDVGFALQKV